MPTRQESKQKKEIQESEYIFPYHYLDLLPQYEHSFGLVKSYRKMVCKIVEPYQGQKILDAGCGDGRLCYDLLKFNLAVYGVDYSQRAIDFAKIFCPGAHFQVCNLMEDCPDEDFDYIVLMEVLEHFEPDKIEQVLSNLSRCLKDKGKLVITVPSVKSKLIPKHYQHFSPESLKDVLKPYFQVDEMKGHLRIGLLYHFYVALSKLDHIFGPLKKRLKAVMWFYRFLDKILRRVENSTPKKAGRLIAICSKP